nr:spidroin-1-like [Aegilops tauschii subsp. strangulata]
MEPGGAAAAGCSRAAGGGELRAARVGGCWMRGARGGRGASACEARRTGWSGAATSVVAGKRRRLWCGAGENSRSRSEQQRRAGQAGRVAACSGGSGRSAAASHGAGAAGVDARNEHANAAKERASARERSIGRARERDRAKGERERERGDLREGRRGRMGRSSQAL